MYSKPSGKPVLSSSSALIGKFILSMWVRAGDEPATLSPVRYCGSTTIKPKARTKSIVVAPKRRGRPPSGGRDPGVHIRLPEDLLAAIDRLAAAEGISRSEAIRRLCELGLKAKAGAGGFSPLGLKAKGK